MMHILFRHSRFMLLQWRVYHSKTPWTCGAYYDALWHKFGLYVHVDPHDGDLGRAYSEPVLKGSLWPCLIYVKEEPDWKSAKIWICTFELRRTGLIRLLRAMRKLWPWSQWQDAATLGVGHARVYLDGMWFSVFGSNCKEGAGHG